MTPRTTIRPLRVTPGNGTSPASTRELVQTQDAILLSNATVLGAVTQFQEDLTGRIGRMADTLDGVCVEVTDIKTERRVEAALAAERAKVAKTAAEAATVAEGKHAATAMEERHEQTASVEAHALAYRWRVGIALAATTGLGALALNLLNIFVLNR
jgi:hypothetical protein